MEVIPEENKTFNWRRFLIGDKEIYNFKVKSREFRVSLKNCLGWIIFTAVCNLLDATVFTRVGLAFGFTEKGLITAKLITINYWLCGVFSFVVIVGLSLLFTYMKFKWATIVLSLIMFAVVITNCTGLYLFYSGRLLPY